jgi:ABC-type phosphate transport system substrate-binding protein
MDKTKSHHIAISLFLGTFLGSLFGVAAQLTAIIDAVEVIAAAVNPSPKLHIVGSHTVLGSGIPLAAQWQQDFKELTQWEQSIPIVGKIERQVEVSVKDVGTYNGIKLAMTGQADLLVASAPISDDQIKQLNNQRISIRCAAEIGYDVIVFITHLQNQVDSVSSRSIENILKGEYTHWSDVNPNWEAKPIHVFVRPGSGTSHLILKAFTDSDEHRPHFIECPSNDACFNSMLGTQGSTYWVSSTWLYTQPSNYLHPFFIRHEKFELPQNPFLDDFKPDHYHSKMIRPLYMYVLTGGPIDSISSDLAKTFFEYVRGVQGQDILEKSHFYTYFDPPTEVKVELPEGFGPRPNQRPVVCK